MQGNVLSDKTLLFGLMSGHFDQKEKADVDGSSTLEVTTRINSGVGLVTPAKYIVETLDIEELVESRRNAFADIKRREANQTEN